MQSDDDDFQDCGLSNEKSQSYFPHYWKFCRQYEVVESQRSFGPGFVIVNEVRILSTPVFTCLKSKINLLELFALA